MDKLGKTKLTEVLVRYFNIVVCSKNAAETARFDSSYGVCVCGKVSDDAFDDVIRAVSNDTLTQNELNKTFYKNFKQVTDKTRFELFIDQVIHYMTTYGTNFTSGFVYISNENFDVELPNKEKKVPVRVVTAVTKKDAISRIVDFINTGVSLENETLMNLLAALKKLGYKFKGTFANKEANVIVANEFGIMPESAEDFLRFVIFKVTGTTLLIKNKRVISQLTADTAAADYVNKYVTAHGIDNLARVFNRFKPLFLAIKANSDMYDRRVINKIAKRSKQVHKPLVTNALNQVTHRALINCDDHWLKNATVYALLRALNAVNVRLHAPTHNVYRVRNGKFWADDNQKPVDVKLLNNNYARIISELKTRVDGQDQYVLVSQGIEYGLPTTEKAFIGNVPSMTRITRKTLNVGMYWENSFGSHDLDLSCISADGDKVGWNAAYYDRRGTSSIVYSGDITDAENGAVEFLRFKKGCGDQIVFLNVFWGEPESDYNVIVGKSSKLDAKKMQKEKNLDISARKTTRNNYSVLGVVYEDDDNVCFAMTDLEVGCSNVSGCGKASTDTLSALVQLAKSSLTLNEVLAEVGYKVVDNEDEIGDNDFVDLRADQVSKDSIIALFASED